MKEVITLRGGLGTTVLTLFHAYSLNIAAGLNPPVDEIQINVHQAPLGSREDWLSKLFEMTIPCAVVPAEQIFKDHNPSPEGFALSLQYRQIVLDKYLKLRYNDTNKIVDKVLHVRGTDNQFISEDRYCELADEYKPTLIGDDHNLISKISKRTGCTILRQNAVDDWHTTIYAKHIIGGLSTFILSGSLINPDRKVSILGRNEYDGPKAVTDLSYNLFDDCVKMLPNGGWIV
jgi:hypothetical protein